MKTERKFLPADRYVYDFGPCSVKNGFAQIDTSQDASYFGTWANPQTLVIVSYCEGDVTIQTADNAQEFANELRNIKAWNDNNDHTFKGIDPGLNSDIESAFASLGLDDLLH